MGVMVQIKWHVLMAHGVVERQEQKKAHWSVAQVISWQHSSLVFSRGTPIRLI